jgi:xanthine/CO dehydrogenase XdhC/CoxF family maturation factor
MKLTELKPKHQGAHSELVAAAWLRDHGYEVFRNMSAFGPIDIVGIKNGVIELFDVKTGSGGQTLSAEAQDLGVKVLIVDGDQVRILGRRDCAEYHARLAVSPAADKPRTDAERFKYFWADAA